MWVSNISFGLMFELGIMLPRQLPLASALLVGSTVYTWMVLWPVTKHIYRPVQDHFEKDPDQILFFKKDLDQDPFRIITSEKRIWIRSFSDHLWKKDLDQILFGSPPKKGSGSRSFSDHLWKKDLDHGSKDLDPDHDPWSRSWILDLQIKISSHYWVTFSL